MNTNRITLISLFATVILPLAACNQTIPASLSQDAPTELAAPVVSNTQTANLTVPRYFSSRTFYNTADLRRDNGQFSSIALDGAGNAVIAYYDGVRNNPGDFTGPYGNGDLKLVVCGNPNCINPVITTVDRGRLQYTEDVGKHVSMVLDAKGNPVMLYASKEDGLKLARCLDATCTRSNIQIVAPVNSPEFGQTSLSLDGSGRPVFTFSSMTPSTPSYPYPKPDSLYLVRCGDANCSARTSRMVDLGGDNSLALDKDGNALISYYEPTHAWLKLARCDAKDTSRTTCPSVFVDGDPTVKARNFGASDYWKTLLDAGQSNSLVLVTIRDVLGQIKEQHPLISYYDATNGDLKIAYCTNANCSSDRSNSNFIQTLDSAGNVGQMTSLKWANRSGPVISYYDATNQDLKIAYCDPGQPLAKVPTVPCQETKSTVTLTIDSVGDAGQNSSLALDANDNPVISYYQATYASLRMIRGQ